MKRKNVKGLALTPAAAKPPPPAESKKEDEQLEIGIEYKLDLKPEDLDILKELGSGNGGTVSKVKHLTTGTVMARKVWKRAPFVYFFIFFLFCCVLLCCVVYKREVFFEIQA